jgi:hypothetical protein
MLMGTRRQGAGVPDAEESAREPLTLIGRRGDAVDAAREFLEGNGVAVRWIDLERDPLVAMLPGEELEKCHCRWRSSPTAAVSRRRPGTSNAQQASIAPLSSVRGRRGSGMQTGGRCGATDPSDTRRSEQARPPHFPTRPARRRPGSQFAARTRDESRSAVDHVSLPARQVRTRARSRP